jgi:dTDP-4-dehydrorhamnose reductase
LKIALIGSNGQLGTDIMSYFKEKGENIIGLTQDEIDVCYIDKCEPELLNINPDLIINTAAFHKVDLCEDEGEEAFKVNAVGVKNLCNVCLKLNIPLMHFSTDFVFGADIKRRNPYIEDDNPAPLSLYGISKLAGEYVMKYMLEKYYLVRSCGLYGHAGSFGKGSNFVDLMIQFAEDKKGVEVVNDQVLTPTSTKDLTEKLYELIHTGKYGLYHMTNTGFCSWYDFAVEIFKLADINIRVLPITSEKYAAKVRRPFYSVLDNKNLRSIGIKDMRPWQEALKDYIDEKIAGKVKKDG